MCEGCDRDGKELCPVCRDFMNDIDRETEPQRIKDNDERMNKNASTNERKPITSNCKRKRP